MSEELELLSAVAGKGGENKPGSQKGGKFEASIIATFNAYLPFYEDVVLRRLFASGCHHNVLLLDRASLSQSLSMPTTWPRLAGRSYTLVPMRAPGAFHPKVALLVGKKAARVFIGSHNVTLSGFGTNRELTTQIDLPAGSEDPQAPLAQAVWAYLKAWLNHQGKHVPDTILAAVHRVAASFAPWLKEQSSQSGDLRFVGSLPEGASLWDSIRPLLPKKAKQVVAMGPFFDRGGGFLGALKRDLRPDSMVIGVEPETVQFCRQESLPKGTRIVDASRIGRGSGYVHAKVLWIDGGSDGTALITGSANPSTPAWTEGGTKRNAEACLLHLGEMAQNFASILGITSVPSFPELGNKEIRTIAKQGNRTDQNSDKKELSTVIFAETKENGILLHSPGITVEDVENVLCWDQVKGKWREVKAERHDSNGIFVKMASNEVSITQFLEVNLINGRRLRAFVHQPAMIARLSRTSKQQRFREALDSLETESPDLPTVIRLASKLIFDEDISEIEPKLIHAKHEKKSSPDGTKDLGPLSVSNKETKQYSLRVRQLQGGDLAYILDTLIYRLGIGLKSAVELMEETGPSEEEKVGMEDEDSDIQPKDIPSVDIAKVCHGKIRTLVSRMVKNLEKKPGGNVSVHRPVGQLLAVLAILREVRSQDRRLKVITQGQTLVPLAERRRLLDGSLVALFANKQGLFRAVLSAFKDDPEEDIPRLIGLLVWLAWDCALDARKGVQYNMPVDDRKAYTCELAALVQLWVLADHHEAAIDEAKRSVWRTIEDKERESATRWLNAHATWARSLNDLFNVYREWPFLEREPRAGDVGVPLRERVPTLRVVMKSFDQKISFAEPGDKDSDHAYQRDSVACAEMPPVQEV